MPRRLSSPSIMTLIALVLALSAARQPLAAGQDVIVFRCPGNVYVSSADLPAAELEARGCRALASQPVTIVQPTQPTTPPVAKPPRAREPTEKQSESSLSYGTAFRVSEQGLFLTNRHVVAGCSKLRIGTSSGRTISATVRRSSSSLDLALLETDERTGGPVAIFRTSPARAGEMVVAIGYPYYGLLASDAIVATGTVSALAGLGNDSSRLQVQVPVQPGNSGGPLLDAGGRVVGVIVARLSDAAIAARTGSLPQNVNFAVKGELARRFLEAADVKIATDEGAKRLELVDVVEKSSGFVAVVECKT